MSSERRLPVYLILDSRPGISDEAFTTGVAALIGQLANEPSSCMTALSVIQYGGGTGQLCPLTGVDGVDPSALGSALGSAPLGEALSLLERSLETEVRPAADGQPGDYKPLIFVLTFHPPTGDWQGFADRIKGRRDGNIIAVAAWGAGDPSSLRRVTEIVIIPPNQSVQTFIDTLEWLRASVRTVAKGLVEAGADHPVNLPALPASFKTAPPGPSPAAPPATPQHPPEEEGPRVRRLALYLVLDCSEEMRGEPLEALKQGLQALVSELKGDPVALETAFLSVITFGDGARKLGASAGLLEFRVPGLEISPGGRRDLGAALELLDRCLEADMRRTPSGGQFDWRPVSMVMVGGMPTDDWEGAADRIKRKNSGTVIACVAGSGADASALKRITETVVELEDLQPDALKAFFRWVS